MTRSASIILGVTAAVSSVAQADTSTPAERLYYDGQAAFDARKYDDAIVAWEHSYALAKQPAILFNLAQAYRLRARPGDCTHANADYRKFIAEDPSSPQRPVAQGFLVEIQPCVDREDAATKPAKPIAPVVQTPPKQLASHSALPLAGVITGAAGVALVGTGLLFGRHASQVADQVAVACATGCTWNDALVSKQSSGQRAEHLMWAFDGVGAAAIVTGAILIWVGHSRSNETSSPVTISASSTSAVAAWSGRW